MSSNDSLLGTIQGLLKGAAMRAVIKGADNSGSSLVGLAQPTRVEPITLIDTRLEGSSYLGDVLGCLNNLYSGFYLQAASVLANIDRVETLKTLDSLNPKREAWAHLVNLANSNLDRNMTTGELRKKDIKKDISTESHSGGYPQYHAKLPLPPESVPSYITLEGGGAVGTDLDRAIRESPNLCIGRLLEVKFTSRGSEGKEGYGFTVPVNVRLLTTFINTVYLRDLILSNIEDNSWSGRWQKVKTGEISFWSDFIAGRDLIRNHKRLLAADKDGIVNEIYTRQRENAISEFATNQNSFAQISNILVLDDSTRKDVEYRYGRSLHDFSAREDLIDQTGFMIIAIIDREHEKVTIYSHTIKAPQILDLREVRGKNSKNGPDVAEILKAYQAGSTPNF